MLSNDLDRGWGRERGEDADAGRRTRAAFSGARPPHNLGKETRARGNECRRVDHRGLVTDVWEDKDGQVHTQECGFNQDVMSGGR